MSRVQRPASSVQRPAFVLCVRVVLVVALLWGMLPSQAGAAPGKLVAEKNATHSATAPATHPFSDSSLASGLPSAPGLQSSLNESLLPQFQPSSSPSRLSADETPPDEAGAGVGVEAPAGEAAPEPGLMLAPGALSLDTSDYLLAPGQAVTVTVRVAADPGGSTEGETLQLSLSPGLEVLGGQMEWVLPDVDGLAEPYAQELVVAAANPQPGEVFAVNASLAQSGFLTQTVQLLLGGASEAEVVVLTAPTAARRGLRVTVSKEWPVVSQQSSVSSDQLSVKSGESSVVGGPSSVVGGQPSLYLPVVAGGGAKAQEDGDGFVRRWRIGASRGREAVAELEEAATLLISTRSLEAAGVDVAQLRLWSREDEGDDWQVTPVRYLAEQQLFVAQTRHFSQWALGENLSASGELLPSVKSFAADGFTGYAQVSYPLETPAGLGGMNPGLSLSYSSGTPDDMENFNGTYDYEVQAGWAGHGWNLGGTAYIAKDFANNKYQLVLAGMGAEIFWNGSKWVSDPEQFLKIERIAAPWNAKREDMSSWRITAKNGTQYYFGSDQYDGNGEPIGNWSEVLFDDLFRSSQWESVRVGSKWHLRLAVDPLGNRMEYDYDNEIDWVGGECFRNIGWNPGERYYDKAVYLKEVRWSGNNSAGVGTKLKVTLTRETRPDWKVIGWDSRCVQARYANERLKNVTVYAYDATNGGWPILSKYTLNYTGGDNYNTGKLHSLLSSIDHYGKDGTSLLNSYTFGYAGGWNTVRLSSANNGQGGSMTFSYGWEQLHDCYNCGQINWRSGLPQRRPVIETIADDGLGGQARTVYEYDTWGTYSPKGHVTNGSFEYLGHGWSRAKRYTTDSGLGVSNRLEQREENWYYQRLNSSTVDPRRGRAWQSYIYGSNGEDMQHTHRGWQSVLQNGVYWVYQDWEHVYTADWDGNDNWRGSWSHFFYENIYGNQIRVEQRASDGIAVLRKTETDYTINTGLYIVEKPSRVRVYDGANNCASEVRYTYDSLMRLTRSDTPILACGDTNAANLIQTNRSYDSVGNVTREWTTGTSQDIRTFYDPDFQLFAVRRYDYSNSSLDEMGKYYGVKGASGVGNGLSVSDANAYWGRMQEFCGIDNICTQQAYDGFGRPTARWERSQGYPTVSSAQTRWFYWRKGESVGSNLFSNANIVLEWNAPRCYGNFSRQLYNGFGQLIQSQGPDENWTTNVDGCNPGLAGGEVVVDYAYDGLGRQIRQSVPRSVTSWNWTTSAPWAENWGNGYSETTYDAIGRVLQSKDPSGRTTNSYYSWLQAWTVAKGVGESDRMVSWSQQDDLGRTVLLRSYQGTTTVDAEIQLSYDTTDRLIKSERRNGSAGAWTQLSTLGYDFAGRKTSMSDADLGNWSYAYDKLSQLTRQTDARSKSTCLAYNALGQVTAKTVYNSSGCSSGIASSYSYSYDSLGRLTGMNQTSGGSWSKGFTYDSQGRPSSETVTIDGISKTTTTTYDAYQRPYATQYPDGEVVKVNFNSLGLPKLLCRAYWNSGAGAYYCDGQAWLVDQASYDAAGRLTKTKYPAGGNLWRSQTYYGWTTSKNGGLLNEIKVGTTDGGNDRFYRQYTYNSFGDVATLKEGSTTYPFGYDSLGRLIDAYSKSYTYWPTNRFDYFEGKKYGYGSFPYHGVDTVNNVDRYDYDANGNMTVRDKGLGTAQTLAWNAENRLAGVTGTGVNESYAYDADGNRIKKISGGVTTRTFFPGVYEEDVSGSTTTAIKHYSFNGMTIAVKRGSDLRYTHTDHLGSSSGQTDSTGNAIAASYLRYNAYGTLRSGDPTQSTTDRTFTGQKQDGTGLHYYNARYYDSTLGTFLSPDTLVPDAGRVVDYNRFLYVRGNPLKYSDPSGHCPAPSEGTNIICVDLFIASKWIALGFGHGDNRTFDSDSPENKSRAYTYIQLDENGKVLSNQVYANESCTAFGCAGPYEGHNSFDVTQDPDSLDISITWNLSNGITSAFHDFADNVPLNPNLPTMGSAETRAGPGILKGMSSAALPNINGTLTLSHNGDGGFSLKSVDRDPYPSLEVYQYRSGNAPQTIYQDEQIPFWTPSLALNPLFPNRREQRE